MDIDVRIYYQTHQDQLLTRTQAIAFLLNGALPERILLATAGAEQIARYQAASPEQQAAWRHAGGTLTVANGHMALQRTREVPSQPVSKWQPYDKQDCQVWFDYTDGSGRIIVGGTSRDLGTSLGFLRAQGLAMELLAAAETRRIAAAATGEQPCR